MKLKTLIVRAAAVLAGTLASAGLAAPTPATKPIDPKLLAEMNDSYSRLDALLKTLPRDQFESAAIVELAGRDATALSAWVRDNTRLLPYRGALRGPAGVLLDRGGNSLDRSLLLAELLHQAGYEVRLATGTLSPAQAADLLQRSATPLPTGGPADGQVQAVRQRAAAQADRLLKQLGEMPAGEADRTRSQHQADLSEHWWVQKKGEGNAWQDLDVTGLTGVQATRTVPFAGEAIALPLPATDLHEVDIRVLIEVYRDGGLQTLPVLQQAFRPADLLGRTIVFSHFAGRAPAAPAAGDPVQQIKQLATSQKTYVPMISVDGRAYTEAAFTTDGEINRDFNLDPAGKLAAGIGKAAGGAFGGLTGGDALAAKPGVLTAQWIEFEIRSPGRKPAVVRREVFDLLGPAARAAGVKTPLVVDSDQQLRRGLRLAGQNQILLQACELTPAYVLHQLARAETKDRAAWMELSRPDANPKATLARVLDRQFFRDETTPAFALFRSGAAVAPGATYIDRPNVVQYCRWLEPKADGSLTARQQMDLAYTSTAADTAHAVDAFQQRVRQGVADTLAEHLTLGDAASPGENTVAILEAAPASTMTVVRPGEAAALAALKLPPDAAARAAADLAAGNVLVLSPGMAAGRWTWWRVDAATGQTVGVMDHGYCSATAEREAQIQAELNGYAGQIGRDLTNKSVRTAKPGDIASWVRGSKNKISNPEGMIKNLEGIQLELDSLWKQQIAMRGGFV